MIFLGIKDEPLSDPLSLKFVSGAPGNLLIINLVKFSINFILEV